MNESSGDALRGLYPFLHGKKQNPDALNAALLESVTQKAAHNRQVLDGFFAANQQGVVDAAVTIAESYREGGKLLTMGNGGSSCDAAHLSVEFLHPVTAGRPALRAVDLTCDTTMMTAVANDVGYQHVFARQVIAQAKSGDCLFGLSTSGNSENLIEAFRRAKQMGLSTIGLAGMSGGAMLEAELDHCLVVETDSIHRIQECHVAIYHILWDLVHTLLADDRGDLQQGEGGR